MKTHHLHIGEETSFTEMGEFIYENKVSEGDSVKLEINIPGFDFIHRRFLYALFREGISSVRKMQNSKALPSIDYPSVVFHENGELISRLSKDTGVNFSIV